MSNRLFRGHPNIGEQVSERGVMRGLRLRDQHLDLPESLEERAIARAPHIDWGDPTRWGGTDTVNWSVPSVVQANPAVVQDVKSQQVMRVQSPDLISHQWELLVQWTALNISGGAPPQVVTPPTVTVFLMIAAGAGLATLNGEQQVMPLLPNANQQSWTQAVFSVTPPNTNPQTGVVLLSDVPAVAIAAVFRVHVVGATVTAGGPTPFTGTMQLTCIGAGRFA